MSKVKVELGEHGLFDGRFYLIFRATLAALRDRVSVTFDDDSLTSYEIESRSEQTQILNAVHSEVARMKNSPELAALRAQV